MSWCAHESMPKSLDENSLLKTQIIPTDDDPQLHGSFEASLSRHESKHGKNGKYRSCKWHKVRTLCVSGQI